MGQAQIHEPDHWWLGRKRGYPFWCSVVFHAWCPEVALPCLAAFAGESGETLSGQPSGHPLHPPGWASVEGCQCPWEKQCPWHRADIALSFGASREEVRYASRRVGAGGSYLADEILITPSSLMLQLNSNFFQFFDCCIFCTV